MTPDELQSWMKAKKYGPRAAALHFNVNVRTIYRWLRGDRRVPKWLELILK